jgi:NitT/TauT family transport system permease protein
MSEQSQRIWAPVIVFLVILISWEGLVTAFRIEQFLLPKPSMIAGNLLRVVVLDPAATATPEEITVTLRGSRFWVTLPADSSGEAIDTLNANALLRVPWGAGTLLLARGNNLTPILAAAWFTLRGALGGLIIGVTGGVLVALATARWTATREALLPFAIAANSMPIIAFAPIMNNWFGIDNPVSKMAIVAIMVFFPIMINTVRGLVSIDSRALELMRSYAASEYAILWKLRVPNALPYFFSGMKVAGALAMIGAIVGEYFGGPRIALGVFITQEAALFRFASAWAAIIVACVLGIALYLFILLVERLAMPWHVSFR